MSHSKNETKTLSKFSFSMLIKQIEHFVESWFLKSNPPPSSRKNMCCPDDNYHYARSDKYLGHRPVSQAFANYITHNPILHPHHHQTLSPQPQKPLDLYISHVIHASKVPNIVPYTALYLLASLTQPCHCRIPHSKPKSHYALSLPSKFSHTLSRLITRTPLTSRIFKESNWDERHFFMGAFYLAILAYRPVYYEECGHKKELVYQNMINVCEISEEEIREVSTAFKQYIDHKLQSTLNAMLWDKFVISVSEFDCPFTPTARLQKQLAKENSEDGGDECQKGGRRRRGRLSLKESIESFWKLGEKTTIATSSSSVASDSKPPKSVDCGPNSVSDESWSW